MSKKTTMKLNKPIYSVRKKAYTLLESIKNSRVIKFLLQKKVVIITVYLLCIFLILLNLYLTHKIRPYNSDDVSWQNILLHWRPFNGNKLILSDSDNFVFKLPFFIIFENLLEPSRRALLIESTFFSVASFSFFYFAILKFMNYFKVKTSYTNLLPIIWYASSGIAIANMSLNSVVRNIEMGITFVLLFFAFIFIKNNNHITKKFISVIKLLCFIFLCGLIIYSDTYITYFVIAPLMILFAVQFLSKTLDLEVILKIMFITAAIILCSILLKYPAQSLGITTGTNIPLEFVTFNLFFKNISLGIESTLQIFGANFFGLKIYSLSAASAILNFLIFALFIFLLFRQLTSEIKEFKKTNKLNLKSWMLFFGLIYFYSFTLFIFSTMATHLLTYRYFIMAFMSIILFLVLFLDKCCSRLFKNLTTSLFVLAIVFNFIVSKQGYRYNFLSLSNNKTNSNNYILISSLKSNNLYKGYASYWNSGINNYLSNGSLSISPTICTDSKLQIYEWLIDESREKIPSKNSFIIISNDEYKDATCSVNVLSDQFGPPEKIINIGNLYQIYVYPFDILQKIPNATQ